MALLSLLDRFYPQRMVTITYADPDFITPTIKAQLRRKNRLMRGGRVEEAAAVAEQVRRAIIRQSMMTLRHVNTRQCAKEAWAKVHQLTKARSKGGHRPLQALLLMSSTATTQQCPLTADTEHHRPSRQLALRASM